MTLFVRKYQFLARSRRVLSLAALCAVGFVLARAEVSPTIEISSLSPYGASPGSLSGRVVGVSPAAYNVTALIFISGLGFYTKPFCNATTTPIAADGTFSVLLTTSVNDRYATLIALLVVPASATVPCYLGEPGVPVALEQQSVAETLVPRPNPNQREIQFSGETWVVKSIPAPVGPGPNFFSDSQENVWVDNLGRLHLRITNRGGVWYCAEIVSKRVIGYGRYIFQIDTPPQFDKNVVFGAFSWADAERNSREVDMLELGRFGNANDPNNAQNVVQPYTTPGNQLRFVLPQVSPTVHRMTWLPDDLSFQSSDQFNSILHGWTYPAQPPPTDSDRLNFRFNLWLFAPPSDNSEAEIVVDRFSFVPISEVAVYTPGSPLAYFTIDSNGNKRYDGADRSISFNGAGSVPVTGDWNGTGRTKAGVYSNGFWYLDYNGNGTYEPSVDRFYNFGVAGATPVVGDWNKDGRAKIGIYYQGYFCLDMNGDGIFQPGTDAVIGWGPTSGCQR
jgi:hypothetical protein